MCGRITQKSGELPGLVTVTGVGDSRLRTRSRAQSVSFAPRAAFSYLPLLQPELIDFVCS